MTMAGISDLGLAACLSRIFLPKLCLRMEDTFLLYQSPGLVRFIEQFRWANPSRLLGTGHSLRGGGGYKTGGGAREVLPLRKGGAEKVLAMLKGGHKFWGSFYTVA